MTSAFVASIWDEKTLRSQKLYKYEYAILAECEFGEQSWVCSLPSMIMSFQVLGPKEHELAEQNEYNFDHPDAFDFDLLIKTLRRLKEGKKVEVPIYNFLTHSREKHSVSIHYVHVCRYWHMLLCRQCRTKWKCLLGFKTDGVFYNQVF